MRRTLERKFEGMSPRERRKEVLRMQRIERAARALIARINVNDVKESAARLKGVPVFVKAAKLRDLADALGMYDDPNGPSKRSTD